MSTATRSLRLGAIALGDRHDFRRDEPGRNFAAGPTADGPGCRTDDRRRVIPLRPNMPSTTGSDDRSRWCLSLRGRTDVPEDGFDLVLLAADGTVLASAIGGARRRIRSARGPPRHRRPDRHRPGPGHRGRRRDRLAAGDPAHDRSNAGPHHPRLPPRDHGPVHADHRLRRGPPRSRRRSRTPRSLERAKAAPDWDPGEPPVLTGFRDLPRPRRPGRHRPSVRSASRSPRRPPRTPPGTSATSPRTVSTTTPPSTGSSTSTAPVGGS